MKKRIISRDEQLKIWRFYISFRSNPVLNKLLNTKQHRTSNTYRHVSLVAKKSVQFALKRNLDIDYYSLIRGAFLHDLFFYDWRKEKSKAAHHLTRHPQEAYENAKQYFDLNDIEKDIIVNHMWPVTFRHFPRTKEGRIVNRIDKAVTFKEVFSKKKDIIIFDLDGTLLDTLDDLMNAVNYALKKHHYPTRDKEFVRLAIGNGTNILIKRCAPAGTSEEEQEELLKDFRTYYFAHVNDYTKPYPGNYEALRELKRRGYRLAVATNKLHSAANDLISVHFPGLFEYVQGDDGHVRKKPSYDMIAAIRGQMRIRRNDKILYVGDTNVDYQTAKNAGLKCVIVTYGYRTKDEMRNIVDKKTPTVSTLGELVTYLDNNKPKRL
ncbi:MAG: HAD family hydrolase [Erysipelotrichaceae bacterium]|nr:HAD family hydrolase [Erysipelotrichaceae bacterium]